MANYFHASTAIRISLIALLMASAAASGAQEQSDADRATLDNNQPRCEQRDDTGQCQDNTGSETSTKGTALEAARKAAIRHHNLEQRALQELLLQRACNTKSAYCAQNAAPDCVAQLEQMCASIAQQAATCLLQAAQYCGNFQQSSDCIKQREAQCPSTKKQSVDVLLAKYPKLSARQATHIRQVATQIDENLNTNWIGDLFRWLGFSS